MTERGSSRRPGRMARRRAAVLVGVHLVLVAHVAWWWFERRPVLSPLEPSEAMRFGVEGVVNAGLLLFAVAGLATLVFGRFFCGWGCHLIALQDGCRWLLLKLGLRPKPFRSRLLRWVPVAAFVYMFLGTPLLRAFRGEPWPGFRGFELTTQAFWATMPTWPVAVATFLVCGGVVVWLLGSKAYCTYACPYGALFTAVEALAPGRIRVDDSCRQCGKCTAACTSDVRVHAEVHAYGMVVDPGCMKCMDCVDACPNGALSYGWGRPAVLARERAVPAPGPKPLPWGQDLLALAGFLVVFVATRGLYGEIPFLFALGLGGVGAWLAWTTWASFRRSDLRFARWPLRRGGRTTRAGRVFRLGALAAWLLVAHSLAYQAVSWKRDRVSYAMMGWGNAVLAGTAEGTPPEVRALAEEVLRLTALSERLALLPDDRLPFQEAWARLALGDEAGFQAGLDEVLRRRPGFGEVLLQRGLWRWRRGDVAGARADWEAIPWSDPRWTEARAWLADLEGRPRDAAGGEGAGEELREAFDGAWR